MSPAKSDDHGPARFWPTHVHGPDIWSTGRLMAFLRGTVHQISTLRGSVARGLCGTGAPWHRGSMAQGLCGTGL
eukprot:1159304-Pelagomonas_calceolata.AAC.8